VALKSRTYGSSHEHGGRLFLVGGPGPLGVPLNATLVETSEPFTIT